MKGLKRFGFVLVSVLLAFALVGSVYGAKAKAAATVKPVAVFVDAAKGKDDAKGDKKAPVATLDAAFKLAAGKPVAITLAKGVYKVGKGINIVSNTVTITGVAGTVLDGGNVARVITAKDSTVTVKGVTITGGKAYVGGAIYLNNCSKSVIDSVTFVSNTAVKGAAVYIEKGAENKVTKSTFTANTVTASGFAGGVIQVKAGTKNVIDANKVTLNNAKYGYCAGIAVYRGTNNAVTKNTVVSNAAAYAANFQIIFGGSYVTKNDPNSATVGLVISGNIVQGTAKKNEYAIAEEVGVNGFIDMKGQTIMENDIQTNTVTVVYRNSVGYGKFKNIVAAEAAKMNDSAETGAAALAKKDAKKVNKFSAPKAPKAEKAKKGK